MMVRHGFGGRVVICMLSEVVAGFLHLNAIGLPGLEGIRLIEEIRNLVLELLVTYNFIIDFDKTVLL